MMEKDFDCTKVKDGLYLATKTVAYDLEFLVVNKFGFVVNCASEVPKLFEAQGIRYQKFKIPNDRHQRIFDEEYKRLKLMKKIVQQAEETGMCCMVHCGVGHYRSLVLLMAFLMDHFNWRLRKVVDFLQSKGIPIVLSESHIEQLVGLERHLSMNAVMTLTWEGPYADEEEELISKTYINTSNVANSAKTKKKMNIKKELMKEEPPKQGKRVQWQDRLEKKQQKERKKLVAEQKKEEKAEGQRSRQKLENAKKEGKAPGSSASKGEAKGKSTVLDPSLRKQIEEAEIMSLIKSTGKLKREFGQEVRKPKVEVKQVDTESDMNSLKVEESNKGSSKADEDGKVYKLTINNYINPNINIIKKDGKKKTGKTGIKKEKEKDKFNRTYSEKEAFKKPTLYEKEKPREALFGLSQKEKRNAGVTPLRQRKQRKSQKERDLQV